jgi:hypothetical protein
MLAASAGKSSIAMGCWTRLGFHSRQSEKPKKADGGNCKVSLRHGTFPKGARGGMSYLERGNSFVVAAILLIWLRSRAAGSAFPSCCGPADALHGRGIDTELCCDLPHAGTPRLTQRGLYGCFLRGVDLRAPKPRPLKGWLFLAGQLRRAEATFTNIEVTKRRSKRRVKASAATTKR